MKVITLLSLILVFTSHFAEAQQKPKPKEKAPTQKEIDAMIKEAQMQLNGIGPADKKMMDSLGIKMPDMGSLPKFTDQQFQEAANEGEFTVPKKDAARISSVKGKPMTSLELTAYIKTTAAKIEQRMDTRKLNAGKEAYAAIKAKYNDRNAISTAASGYWMLGVLQPAIYLMGRACQDDPANPDHLNNYAAFLTMAKAEDLALPILIKLNKDFPKNSTILNNIGHAWLGLGDIALAEKYLDSALVLYPGHSQANFSKALLNHARGNAQAAIPLVKRSLASAYSESKRKLLREQGYTFKKNDLQWNLSMPQEPLIVTTHDWPDYPKTAAQSVLAESEWASFRDRLEKQREGLLSLGRKSAQQSAVELQNKIQAGLKGQDFGQFWLSKKASIMLDYTLTSKSGAMGKLKQKEIELEAARKKALEFENKKELGLAKVHEQFRPLMGEGKPNPTEAYCAQLTAVQSDFLGSVNPMMEEAFKGYLEACQKMANEKVYYQQFMFSATDFEGIKLDEKARWLSILLAHPVYFENPDRGVCLSSPEAKGGGHVLVEFNDLHCNNIIDFDIIIAKWRKACDKSYVDVGVGPINFNLAYNDWKEEIIRGTVEIGASKSIGTTAGPLKAELEGKLTGFVEFDNEGVTDVGVVAGVEAKGGVAVDTKLEHVEEIGRSLSIGVNTRFGWNSGGSVNVFTK